MRRRFAIVDTTGSCENRNYRLTTIKTIRRYFAGKAVKDLFFLRLGAVLCLVILAGTAALWLLLHPGAAKTELAEIPFLYLENGAVHQAHLLALPEWMPAALIRLLHLDPRSYALGLLALLPLLLSVGIDWAAGRRRNPNTPDAPLNDIPRRAPRSGHPRRD